MNAELTELVFILDRSGSMGGLESDTISGFNGMIERQKKEGEKVNVTTILFDDEVEIIHDRFLIDAVQPSTDKEYYVRGCTALLDAVGQAINKIDNVQKHLPEEHRAGKVLFVITTDCTECGAELEEGMTECPNCGCPVDDILGQETDEKPQKVEATGVKVGIMQCLA